MADKKDKKTAIEWLEIARKDGADWVDKAIENIAAQPDYSDRKEDYLSLSSVVIREFSWIETDKDTQGGKYWGLIYDEVFESETQNDEK